MHMKIQATRASESAAARCQRLGRLWQVAMGGRSVLVQHCRGMTYLAVLLANPGHEIAAAELAMGAGSAAAGSPAQSLLDQRAIQGYRRRLTALQRELTRCDAAGDQDGAIRAHAEHDWLLAELRSATGLGGRDRSFTTADERARVAVGKAIRRALHRIATADPLLGERLAASIQTGQRCAYLPHTFA